MATQASQEVSDVQNLRADLENFEAVEIANMCNGQLGVVIDKNVEGAYETKDVVLDIMREEAGFIRSYSTRGTCELYQTLWFEQIE